MKLYRVFAGGNVLEAGVVSPFKMKAAQLFRQLAIPAALIAIGCASEKPTPEVRITAKPKLPWAEGTLVTQNFAVPVLMYHRIDRLTQTESKSPLLRDLTVSPEDFEAQVNFLVKNGYSILSVYDVQKALLEGTPLPEKAVAITMDDGYRDNFEQAFPILKRHGVPATVFVVTSVVGDGRHLTWANIDEMREEGVRFGSHTVRHFDLVSLENDPLDAELADSKSTLESKLSEPISTLAYPAGRFDDRVVDHVKLAGYLTAWDKGGGPVRPGDDPFRLPRVRVHGNTTIEDFKRKVSSGYWTLRIEKKKRREA